MNEQELYRLYAMALTLVPDADVAGDLFMDARNEADLRRRAERWLKAQGLPLPNPHALVPPLDASQREYALHLSRRGRSRRHTKRSLTGLVAVLVLALGLLLRPNLTPASGLRTDQSYKGQPLAMSSPMEGIVFAIYKAEATPGRITLWWTFQGHDAAKLERLAEPVLVLNRGFVEPVLIETDVTRSDRLLGRTVYRAPSVESDFLSFSVRREGSLVRGWRLRVTVTPSLSGDATEVPVNETVEGLDGRVSVRVKSITLAEDYTLVRYEPQGPDYALMMGHMMDLYAGQEPLARYGILERATESEERTVVFAPVPAGARAVDVIFPRLAFRQHENMVFSLPAPDVVKEWHQEGELLRATLQLPMFRPITDAWVAVTDKDDRMYRVADSPGAAPGELVISSGGVPPLERLATLQVYMVGADASPPSLRVSLPSMP